MSETNKPDAATATLDTDGVPLTGVEGASSGPHRLLLIDGHSMAFRAFYALPVENFSTDTGQHTNAVYGFTSMLIKMIEQREPTHVA
ncbi:MAG TPA: hypothetical protein VN601_06810, partial [Arthrobacter sp.]|nr:hypothetical protein [Arthrobacter sp.]